MAILKIYTYPHKVLSQKAEKVSVIDDDTRKLLDNMLETMYNDKGVGLAAPQIGLSKRIIVVDDKVDNEGNPGDNPYYMVNPKIIATSDDKVFFNEGCLSVPGQSADVERFMGVTVEYLDYNGDKQIIEAEGFLAIILQHEIDHLEGVLYIDRISRLKKNIIVKKLLKK